MYYCGCGSRSEPVQAEELLLLKASLRQRYIDVSLVFVCWRNCLLSRLADSTVAGYILYVARAAERLWLDPHHHHLLHSQLLLVVLVGSCVQLLCNHYFLEVLYDQAVVHTQHDDSQDSLSDGSQTSGDT